MSERPSYERFDYSIRTNKNIERKLIFERLQRLTLRFRFQDYRYIGLGSMWFIDFVLAHRNLAVKEMWSFESTDPARADFNKPYHCITVLPTPSSAGIKAMSAPDWEKPAIVWFDYDGSFDADVKSDCDALLQKLAAGSVLLVTVYADKRGYKPVGPADKTAPAFQKLKQLFGDAVPPNAVAEGKFEIEAEQFPGVFANTILNFMTGVVRRSGRMADSVQLMFVPLFNLQHRDGALMVTVGGMIVTNDQVGHLTEILSVNEAQLFAGAGVLSEKLDLVPITSKEKAALDRLLPCEEALFTARLAAAGIKLADEEAKKYRRLYTHFPVFAETVS